MRLSDLAKGSSVFLGVIVAGFLSTTYVDQRFAALPRSANTSDPANNATPTDNSAPSACIGEGGEWKNWPWPNVPMGSPKCK